MPRPADPGGSRSRGALSTMVNATGFPKPGSGGVEVKMMGRGSLETCAGREVSAEGLAEGGRATGFAGGLREQAGRGPQLPELLGRCWKGARSRRGDPESPLGPQSAAHSA